MKTYMKKGILRNFVIFGLLVLAACTSLCIESGPETTEFALNDFQIGCNYISQSSAEWEWIREELIDIEVAAELRDAGSLKVCGGRLERRANRTIDWIKEQDCPVDLEDATSEYILALEKMVLAGNCIKSGDYKIASQHIENSTTHINKYVECCREAGYPYKLYSRVVEDLEYEGELYWSEEEATLEDIEVFLKEVRR